VRFEQGVNAPGTAASKLGAGSAVLAWEVQLPYQHRMWRAAGIVAVTMLWATAAGAVQGAVSFPADTAATESTAVSESPPVPQSTVSGAIQAGIKALKAGRHNDAREHFAVARHLSPQWPLAHLYWAIAETTIHPKSKEGLKTLQYVVAESPKNPRAHYFLGIAYEQAKRYERAVIELRTALQLRPKIKDARFRLGGLLRDFGDVKGAIIVYHDVLQRQPAHMGALTALAELHESAQQHKEAERALRRIAQLQPNIAYHRYQLAQFLERTGQRNKARRALKRAEQIDPRPKRRMRQLDNGSFVPLGLFVGDTEEVVSSGIFW